MGCLTLYTVFLIGTWKTNFISIRVLFSTRVYDFANLRFCWDCMTNVWQNISTTIGFSTTVLIQMIAQHHWFKWLHTGSKYKLNLGKFIECHGNQCLSAQGFILNLGYYISKSDLDCWPSVCENLCVDFPLFSNQY